MRMRLERRDPGGPKLAARSVSSILRDLTSTSGYWYDTAGLDGPGV